MMQSNRGFTLIEIALAMFIIALLLGSILVPLTTQVEQRQISNTQKTLEEIKEAIVGFAVVNGYLPCPDKTSGAPTGPYDTPNDGIEDFNTTTGLCSVISGTLSNKFAMGNVPWATLGVGSADVWGNRFRYFVLDAFARHSPMATTFTLSTSGALRVCQTATSCTTPPALSTSAVVIILSHGKNGLGAINSLSGVQNPITGISADENGNIDIDRDVISRTITPPGSTAGEFDDIVTWLSPNILFNRMVTAGKLP